MTKDKEIWKSIKLKKCRKIRPYKHYEVSNMGRVRNSKTGKIIKISLDRGGYPCAHIRGYNRYGEISSLHPNVHILVADTFKLCKPEDKTQINHIDGDKTNNRLDNLEYVSMSENIKHGFRIGLYKRYSGEKYSDEMIHEICSLIQGGYSSGEISKMKDISIHYVNRVKKRKLRKKISQNYIW